MPTEEGLCKKCSLHLVRWYCIWVWGK